MIKNDMINYVKCSTIEGELKLYINALHNALLVYSALIYALLLSPYC